MNAIHAANEKRIKEQSHKYFELDKIQEEVRKKYDFDHDKEDIWERNRKSRADFFAKLDKQMPNKELNPLPNADDEDDR